MYWMRMRRLVEGGALLGSSRTLSIEKGNSKNRARMRGLEWRREAVRGRRWG